MRNLRETIESSSVNKFLEMRAFKIVEKKEKEVKYNFFLDILRNTEQLS